MPFYIDEPPEQSNWTETDNTSLAFILNKPAFTKGDQGVDGEKGEKGHIGPIGIEGEKGNEGVDGSKGQKGEIGIGQKGEQGIEGDQGSKGQKGELGISVTGQKGEPSLVKGQKGEIGIGEKGIDGEKGQKGEKGIQGENGSKGQKGEIGIIGITGSKGQKGELGNLGNTGSKGQKGEIGLTGDKGQKGEIHSSKFVNNGSLNSSDEIALVYDDGTNMTNTIDISSLRELPNMLNSYYGKRLTVVQPSSGSGVEAMWINQDTYSFTESRTTAQLEVQKVEQNTISPYFNTTTTNTYNFLPSLVNDKVLTVSNGALTWSDFPADDNTRVSGFAIDASHNLSLSQNDGTTPYSVNLAPYLDNTDNYITAFALNNGLITGTMTGGQSNPTGQILPTNVAGFLTNDGAGNLTYSDGKLSNVVKSFQSAAAYVNTNGDFTTHSLTLITTGTTIGTAFLFDFHVGSIHSNTAITGWTATRTDSWGGKMVIYVTNGATPSLGHAVTTFGVSTPNSLPSIALNWAEIQTIFNVTGGQVYTVKWRAAGGGSTSSSDGNHVLYVKVIQAGQSDITLSSSAVTVMSSTNTAAAFTQYSQTFTAAAAGSSATLQFYHLGTGSRKRYVFVSDVQVTGDAQQTIGEQLWNVTGNTLEVMRLEAGNNVTFTTSYGVINISSATGLPTQTNNDDKFLKTDGTNASWTNKIGSSNSHTWFYWNGGTPNHYLLNQATSAGSELGNIAFGNTNGTFYSSISGKVRDSTSGQLRGYIQINSQHGDSSANLDEETLRIGESSHSTSDAGEFFGNLKVAGIKFTNNSVQTLPLISPTSSDVGKFLSATSTGAFDWHNKIGSSTAYNWFYWSGGIINSYLLSQPSSAEDQCGAITFGHTNGNMYATIYGKVRDTTAGQLRGYIQIDTQNNNGTDVLTEETLRIGESTHSTSDAGEFFGNLKLAGVKFPSNKIQTEAVEGPSAADGTANRILTATGANSWAWSDPSAIVVNTLQSGATQNSTVVYNAWYHDIVRGIDALAKLDKSHVQSAYQATPNAYDVYNCAHHDLAFKNTYGILYGNTQSSTYTTGYINQFYRENNNEKNITLVSSNTGQNDTLGSIQAWNGNNHISSAIAFLHSDETTVSGRINFYSYTNNNHATQGPSAYIQDDVTNVKDLEAIGSISLNSVLTTSIISNTCLGNSKIINKSDTTTSTAVIGNVQSQGFVNVTGNVQYPPALLSNTSTVSGITYTLAASTNAFTGSSYDMYKAFDRINGTGWHSLGNYNSSNVPATMGQYQGSNSLGGVNGEWIKLQMSTALPFGSVKVIGRQGYDAQAADSWEILASNNGSSWTSILQSTVHLTYNNGNGHTITINNTTSYSYYALIGKTVAGPSSAYLTIHEIEFYTAVTNTYGEFSDLKTTKYGNDWGLLDINIRQNASLTPLVRIGKSQTADPHQVIINGTANITGLLTLANLRILGTGSGITFDSGLQQSEAVTAPAANLDGYRLTANSSGGWSWASPDVFYDATDRNINIGPINSTLGVDSISIGYYAGQISATRSREQSIFIGTRAGQNTIATSTDTGKQMDNVVMIGHQAGQNSIYMENCCAIGSNAGASVEGNPHTNSNFVGYYSGHDSGSSSTGASSYSNGFFGTFAGRNYVGIESQGFGRDALYTYQKSTTMRYRNNAIGSTSMRNCIGDDNCAQGSATLRWDGSGTLTAHRNIAIGSDAMGLLTNSACQNSNDNVFIGRQAGRQLSGNATGNVSVGKNSGYQMVGNKNVMIGTQAGFQHNGSNCIYIGENQGYQQTESNKLKIGTFQNNQIISGTMNSSSANSELKLNCGFLELDRENLPTSYNSSFPDRIWVDGAGTSTGSNISGVLRIGAVNTQYDSGNGKHNNVLQCANSNSSIFAFTHTSANRTQNNKHNLTISVNSNLEFVYLFDVKPTHAYYIITAQHEELPSSSIVETDTNSFITNKTVNGFTLTFRVGDNSNVLDSPSILCDHSISIMGVSANQIDTSSSTIPQLGQTNPFPTGFNLA